MGVALTYEPTEPPAPEVAETIRAEAVTLAERTEWWCEAIHFFPEDGLLGSTKVFLPGYSTDDGGYVEVDGEEDALMAARDIQIIVEALSDWSRRYGIAWSVGFDGEAVGAVLDGAADAELLEAVQGIAALGGADDFPNLDPSTIERINAKYASRW